MIVSLNVIGNKSQFHIFCFIGVNSCPPLVSNSRLNKSGIMKISVISLNVNRYAHLIFNTMFGEFLTKIEQLNTAIMDCLRLGLFSTIFRIKEQQRSIFAKLCKMVQPKL